VAAWWPTAKFPLAVTVQFVVGGEAHGGQLQGEVRLYEKFVIFLPGSNLTPLLDSRVTEFRLVGPTSIEVHCTEAAEALDPSTWPVVSWCGPCWCWCTGQASEVDRLQLGTLVQHPALKLCCLPPSPARAPTHDHQALSVNKTSLRKMCLPLRRPLVTAWWPTAEFPLPLTVQFVVDGKARGGQVEGDVIELVDRLVLHFPDTAIPLALGSSVSAFRLVGPTSVEVHATEAGVAGRSGDGHDQQQQQQQQEEESDEEEESDAEEESDEEEESDDDEEEEEQSEEEEEEEGGSQGWEGEQEGGGEAAVDGPALADSGGAEEQEAGEPPVWRPPQQTSWAVVSACCWTVVRAAAAGGPCNPFDSRLRLEALEPTLTSPLSLTKPTPGALCDQMCQTE